MSKTSALLFAGMVMLIASDPAWAADMPVAAPPWSWTGFYIGGHIGGAVNVTDIADPFGAPLYGDQVRSPAFVGGGQIGYNYQLGSTVLGLEANASGASSDGTNTCFAVSGFTVSSNCQVRPNLYATLTGHLGYSLGRTLLYAKGGAAWTHGTVDMFVNQNPAGVFTSDSNVAVTGWTVGAGLEYALTPAWSAQLEYDYLDFGGQNVATPYTAGNPYGTAPVTSISQHVHEARLGLNYRFGADAGAWLPPSGIALTPASPATSGWDIEAGARYMYSFGRFQKDLDSGLADGSSAPKGVFTSKLAYDDLRTNSSELFARIDSPWNVFVKGYVGVGETGSGTQSDEDSFVLLNGTRAPYSNSISNKINGNINYGVADLGYDVLRTDGDKIGAFVGFSFFDQVMNRYNCVQIANPKGSCEPPDEPPTPPNVVRFQELDAWRALRVGVSGEAMLTDRLKLAAEAAYVPYLSFSGLDNHFRMPIAQFPASSNGGQGVQLETLLSYDVTDRFAVGLGARYWAMWTANGQFTTTASPGPPRYYRSVFEQAGIFLQTSYRFGGNTSTDAGVLPVSKAPLPTPRYDWTGLHVGVEGGGDWGRSKHIANSNDITPEYNVSGGLVGGTLGYDAQFGGIWLFGLEGDMSWLNASGSAQNQPPFATESRSGTKEPWLGTARTRLGIIAIDRWLTYVTGGVALSAVEADAINPNATFSQSYVRAGWTAGAGVEVAIDKNWSAKLEYLYVGLSDTPYFTPPPSIYVANRGGGVPLSDEIARVGINYKFN